MSDEDQVVPETPEQIGRAPADDAASESDAPPEDDLTSRERRQLRLQRRRERRVWIGLVGAGIVVLVLFLLVFWPVMARRLEAARQLDQAQARLSQAGGTVTAIDKVVTEQLSPDAAAGVADTAPQILVAQRELNEIVSIVDGALPHLTDDEQKRGGLIRTAAKARLEMISRVPTILAASVKAVASKSFADRAGALTQKASAAEITAASNYGRHTASAVESASVSLARIKGELGDARALYSQAASAFPEAGFARYVAYVDLRRQGVSLLSKAAAEWLKGDSAAAADFAVYDRSIGESAVAAKALPSAPGAASAEGFRKVAGFAVDAYAKAKKQALDADKALGSP